mmetsp:Transcript_30335/g.76244  ORF Transcript_30335/g.76244 Transcript_30335/m.76244 type:complete len:146 (-) Transcript_30335:101-538(-)
MTRTWGVCLDGSAGSEKAFDFALKLAKPGDKVVLICVATRYGGILDTLRVDFDTQILEEANSEALAFAKELLLPHASRVKSSQASTEILIRQGAASETIVDIATNSGIDILVLGSRGVGAVQRFFLGSVSEYVSTHAPCHVMVVP